MMEVQHPGVVSAILLNIKLKIASHLATDVANLDIEIKTVLIQQIVKEADLNTKTTTRKAIGRNLEGNHNLEKDLHFPRKTRKRTKNLRIEEQLPTKVIPLLHQHLLQNVKVMQAQQVRQHPNRKRGSQRSHTGITG